MHERDRERRVEEKMLPYTVEDPSSFSCLFFFFFGLFFTKENRVVSTCVWTLFNFCPRRKILMKFGIHITPLKETTNFYSFDSRYYCGEEMTVM